MIGPVRPRISPMPFLVISLVVSVTFLFVPGSAYALGFFTPFGGRVLTEVPCTCGASTLITVGPPRPGTFLITPASRVHKNYRPVPGRWVLGIAAAPAPCMMLVFTILPPFVTCAPRGEGAVVLRIGTS